MKLIKKIYKFFDRKVIIPITKFFVNILSSFKKIKPLEAIVKTKEGLIILSLIISIIIFMFVDKRSTALLETNAKVLYNQPVVASYNDEEYVIEGIPETVDITMIGTKANLYLAKQIGEHKVVLDLNILV